jgi:hypothetical protein
MHLSASIPRPSSLSLRNHPRRHASILAQSPPSRGARPPDLYSEAKSGDTIEIVKVDFKKTLPSYSAKAGRIDLIDISSIRYLAVDAEGDPETSDSFHEAMGVLYPLAYTLKFASKLDLDRDYTVMPLEALWWADDMDSFSINRDKNAWRSTVLMMIPNWISTEMVDTAKRKVASKVLPEHLERVRVVDLVEGRCAQTLHIGLFEEEGPTIEALHAFLAQKGLVRSGKHHEIYLSDPRRVKPAKARTILRQPASPA